MASKSSPSLRSTVSTQAPTAEIDQGPVNGGGLPGVGGGVSARWPRRECWRGTGDDAPETPYGQYVARSGVSRIHEAASVVTLRRVSLRWRVWEPSCG
jgi:hypothetical protein